MEVIIAKDRKELAEIAAGIIREQILRKPNSVLGLATGSTPEETYARLVRYHKEEGLDFSKVVTFNLDEYIGLPASHDQSYNYFMWDRLFKHVNINPENVHVPNGMAPDPEAFCEWYEEEIERAGGIDLQLLGIGGDGHIAFNEPGSSLASRTRVKALTEQTIKDNAELFFGKGNEHLVPRFAITMGVGTILEARKLLLIAFGKRKAAICKKFIEGPVTAMVTASALQLHPNAVVVLDEEAASELEYKDYYKWVQKQKNEEYQKVLDRLAGRSK
ncbi:MAG: glucosamine-6-phosphate deaminase [Candidatus Hydrogenedentota bacterium]|jgi:glucosamine-6-phosphate deaminase|uniref:Glucosamine-6-phosphate deaminase n=1 Tax=Sumerlaea chitinivorans TaxID=2250252 RepID=A0A2Z4Y927_SUMC1|nr:Glucosamine-6-phosphate deaminase [Candidatus Sumerlaea chitinivorans]MCX7963685.1 glucosamine-6-phosphate deaminase [Candidatus Sumerlaea chitinivorans]RMH24070.1 MAG: glucosamine-6-phosphate deaminase [Candidatus Hydrogenedentota bacterium]GIX43740.1 MAG: glucosamine-6-phosphate deaminase [Candidatus Sumerlaea sp.]